MLPAKEEPGASSIPPAEVQAESAALARRFPALAPLLGKLEQVVAPLWAGAQGAALALLVVQLVKAVEQDVSKHQWTAPATRKAVAELGAAMVAGTATGWGAMQAVAALGLGGGFWPVFLVELAAVIGGLVGMQLLDKWFYAPKREQVAAALPADPQPAG